MYIVITMCYALHSVFGCDFDYPNELPEPITAMTAVLGTLVPFIALRETPIAIRITNVIEASLYNCIAVYESVPLDVLTKKAPIVRADDDTIMNEGSSETKALCGFYVCLIQIPLLFIALYLK